MKKKMLAAASVIALFAGGAAFGDYVATEWFDVGSGMLDGAESFLAEVELTGGDVVGFEVQFDFDPIIADDSWASDAMAIVNDPGGDQFTVGGFTNLPYADEEWSFQGPDSDMPGHYGDSGDDIFLPWEGAGLAPGLFIVVFTNDRIDDPNPNLYENVQVRFYQEATPAPGALALLGLAGLAGGRRRRR